MSENFTRSKSVLRLAALALITAFFLQAQARGCDHSDSPIIVGCGYFGIAPGQTLRVNLANLIEAQGRGQKPVDVFARVRVYDAQGRVIAQSAELQIPLKEFRSFNFNRDALSVPGELGTGRLQMRVSLEERTSEPYPFVRHARARGLLPASLEVIDNSTGMTTATLNGFGNDVIIRTGEVPPRGQDSVWTDMSAPIGIVRGQTVRLTAFNSTEPPAGSDGRKYKMLVAALIVDSAGNVLAESDEVLLSSGEFNAFDFNRSDLLLAGEPGTGRLQVRALVRYRFLAVDPTHLGIDSHSALELVDNGTGRTMLGLLLPAVQKPPPR
jgi:hypothetical protein